MMKEMDKPIGNSGIGLLVYLLNASAPPTYGGGEEMEDDTHK